MRALIAKERVPAPSKATCLRRPCRSSFATLIKQVFAGGDAKAAAGVDHGRQPRAGEVDDQRPLSGHRADGDDAHRVLKGLPTLPTVSNTASWARR